jgi:hypothetical protein
LKPDEETGGERGALPAFDDFVLDAGDASVYPQALTDEGFRAG